MQRNYLRYQGRSATHHSPILSNQNCLVKHKFSMLPVLPGLRNHLRNLEEPKSPSYVRSAGANDDVIGPFTKRGDVNRQRCFLCFIPKLDNFRRSRRSCEHRNQQSQTCMYEHRNLKD